MILSNAALNWASVRSGLPLHELLAALTPEREQAILKAYNDWRRSKGLPEDKPVAPATSVPTAPPLPPEQRNSSDIERLMEQIADEVEKEQEEDAILIEETMEAIDSTPIEWVPEEIVEEIATQTAEEAEAEAAEPAPPSVDIDEGTEMDAAEEEPAAPSVDIDEGTDMTAAEPAEPPATEPSSQAEEKTDSVFDRLSAIARTLPKAPDPALYQEIVADLGCSKEVLRPVAEDIRKFFTARHRGTVGIRTFMEWLGE